MKHLLTFAATVVSLALPFSFAQAQSPEMGSWQTFGNGPTHSGYYPASLGPAPFVASWERTFENGINPVAVYGPHVFYTSPGTQIPGKHFGCLDEATGEEVWGDTLPNSRPNNPPTYFEGRVFFVGKADGPKLYAVDAVSGKVKWESNLSSEDRQYEAPAVFGSGIWFAGSYGFYGFELEPGDPAFPQIGTERYLKGLRDADKWVPTFYRGVIYSWTDGSFTAWDSRTGDKLWELQLESQNFLPTVGTVPAILNGRAILIGKTGVKAVDLRKRAEAWHLDGVFVGTAAIDQEAAYFIFGNSVVAYHVATGIFVRRYDASAPLSGQPIVTNDRVLVSGASETYIFDKSTGSLLQTLPKGGCLGYAAGRLFITSVYQAGKPGVLSTYTISASDFDPRKGLFAKPAPTPEPATAPEATTKLIYKFAGKSQVAGENQDLRLTVTGYFIWAPSTDETAYLTLHKKKDVGLYSAVKNVWLPWRVSTGKSDLLIFGGVGGSNGLSEGDPYVESLFLKGKVKHSKVGTEEFDVPATLQSAAWAVGSDGGLLAGLVEYGGVYALDRAATSKSNSAGETIEQIVARITGEWQSLGYQQTPGEFDFP